MKQRGCLQLSFDASFLPPVTVKGLEAGVDELLAAAGARRVELDGEAVHAVGEVVRHLEAFLL